MTRAIGPVLRGGLIAAAGLAGLAFVPVVEVVPAVPREFLPQPAALPVLSLVLACAASLALHRPADALQLRRAIAIGLVVGLAGAFALAAVQTAAQARTMQLRGPYALWSMGYVLTAAAALTGAGASVWARGDRIFGTALLTVAASVPVMAAATGALVVLALTAIGTGAGLVLGVTRPQALGLASRLLASPRATIAIVVAATFLTRLAFGLQLQAVHGSGPGFAVASDDGDTYYRYARMILGGTDGALQVFANGTYSPGYPVLLAVMLWLGSVTFVLVIALHALLAAAAAALVVVLARQAGGHAIAVGAGTLFAAQQNLIQIQSTFTTEALLLPALLLYTFALVRYDETRLLRWIVIAGGAMAVAILTRNVIAIFALVGVWWLIARATAGRRRPALAHGLVLVALAAVAILPTAYATWAVTGSPRLANQATSLSWEIGTGTWEAVAPSNVRLVERGLSPFRDPGGTLARFLADPLPVLSFYAEVVPRRVVTLLFRPNFGQFDPLTIVSSGAERSALAELITTLTAAALAAGIVAGLRQSGSRGAVAGLLVAFVATYLVLFSLVFAPLHPVRYRVPIDPYLIVLQSTGVVFVATAAHRWLRARRKVGP